LNDAEQRATQANRQLDRLKKETAQQQTKRESVRVKREETRSGTPDQTSKELSDMRLKIQTLEKELQIAQTELKNRQQAYATLELRVKTAESTPKPAIKEEDSDIKV
jgi:chromosome segregation ATPase